MTETLTREIQVRAAPGLTDRTFSGIGVPWDDPISIYGFNEAFDRGAVQDSDGALIFWRHSEPIGKLLASRDDSVGWNITGKLSQTPRGDEALTLLRDEVITTLSVSFEPIEHRVTEDGTVVHTKVKVREISLVPFPAYPNAKITEVREQPTPKGASPMTADTLTREALATELDNRAAEQERALDTRFASFSSANQPAAPVGSQWRSAAEFAKALVAGDATAATFHREYAGSVVADTAPRSTWIADAIKLIDKRRTVINSFTRQPLPPEGMTLEYVKLATNSIVVSEQVKEGDDLAFGKVTLTTDTAPVKTYGGYTSLSRQTIERGSVNLLNTSLRAMDIAYARTTELAARTLLLATIAAQKAAGNGLILAAEQDAYDWIDLIIDAYDLADDRGFALEGLKVSKDIMKRIVRLETTGGQSLVNVQGDGVNQVASLNAKLLTAKLANVDITILPGAPANTATFADPVAITTFESAGAPVQLQDENIINLTKDYSKYGYLAFAAEFPTALIPVTFGA